MDHRPSEEVFRKIQAVREETERRQLENRRGRAPRPNLSPEQIKEAEAAIERRLDADDVPSVSELAKVSGLSRGQVRVYLKKSRKKSQSKPQEHPIDPARCYGKTWPGKTIREDGKGNVTVI